MNFAPSKQLPLLLNYSKNQSYLSSRGFLSLGFQGALLKGGLIQLVNGYYIFELKNRANSFCLLAKNYVHLFRKQSQILLQLVFQCGNLFLDAFQLLPQQ